MEAAAEKYGFEFQLFDANFSPAEQLKQVQNSVAGNFDGYIIAPTAGAPACNMWRQFLEGTGKPVVVINLPMCGDADHTDGISGTVTMQGQPYFDAHIENAFASCEGTCKAVAVGGFLGSDLFNLWNNAVINGDEKYENVEVVSNQPGNFDPRTALRVVQDALSADPDISIVVSSWDDMTRGVEQAITSAGKIPGVDVRIYSVGGNADAIERVKQGTWNSTTVLLPFEESYYGGVAMAMALSGDPLDGYVNEADLPAVTDGPGTIFLTAENADLHEPSY
jgi:ABC-type sugar transport system substrate-binding protein